MADDGAQSKFKLGDRVKIVEKLFPSFNQGLFANIPSVGRVVEVHPKSILPYRVAIDTFEHHTFWFYANQLAYEDDAKEKAWVAAHKPEVKGPAVAGEEA